MPAKATRAPSRRGQPANKASAQLSKAYENRSAASEDSRLTDWRTKPPITLGLNHSPDNIADPDLPEVIAVGLEGAPHEAGMST